MDFVVDGIGYHVVTDSTGWRTITRLDGLPMTEIDFRRAGMSPASFAQPAIASPHPHVSTAVHETGHALAVVRSVSQPAPVVSANANWLWIGAAGILLLIIAKR